MVIFAASVTAPAICLREIGDEFGLDLASRGFLASLRMGALLAALLVSGHLADRFGKGVFLFSGALLLALGTAGTSFATGFAPLLAAQAIVGLGTGGLEALLNPLITELHPRNPARPLNIINGLFSLGIVAAALLSGEMLEAGAPWRATLQLWIPPALAAAILFATRRYPRPLHEGARGAGRGFLRQPFFWTLMVTMVIAGGTEAGMTFWGASFMEHELAVSARGGALTVAFFGAFMALGRFGSGWIVGRVDPSLLTALSALACAGATAGLSFASTAAQGWALFALGGLFVACFWPTLLAIAAERVQSGSTAMFALLAGAGITGCMVYPWAIGAIGDLAGLRVGVALMPATLLVQAALLLVSRRRAPST